MATDPLPSQMPGCPRWREGDIAFLRHEREFLPQDCHLLGKYIPKKAASHPVIVLRRLSGRSTHVLITTVSAYSTEKNGYLPPWKQEGHQEKRALDFRSFEGTERVSDCYPPLFLQPGQAMPKAQASWVHIQSVWAVPITVLKVFTKTPTLLSMHPGSLAELRRHMADKCVHWRWRNAQSRLAAAEAALPGPWTHPPAVLVAPFAPAAPAAAPAAPAAAITAPAFPALSTSVASAASEATSAAARTGPLTRVTYAAALRAQA